MTPQETESDLSVSARESEAGARVDTGLFQGQGHWQQPAWEVPCASRSPFGRASGQTIGQTQTHPSTENWIKDLLSTVLPIRGKSGFPNSQSLPSGRLHKSHPHQSEGRQNENHNHRKLTKMITWITALCNLMKL